jgi:hypothetical protein
MSNINQKNKKRKYHYKTHQESIHRGDTFYIIKQTDDESREVFLDRANYIINILDNDSQLDIDRAIQFSYIWRNYTLYGMTYPSTLLKTIPS